MDESTTTADVTQVVPAEVRTHLERGTQSVLVDTQALEAVRQRFDEEQATVLGNYLSSAQSPNTLRAYRTDWAAFTLWCEAEQRQSLPADPIDVAVYLATAASTPSHDNPDRWALSPATLERKAAAIAAVHGAHGLPSPTRADVVRLTLRGIRRRRRAQPERKHPLLLHTLETLLEHRPSPEYPGGVARRRDALLLLTGFAGALRRSELAALTFDDVTVDTEASTGDPLLIVRLAATKTDQQARHAAQVALPRGRRPVTCPICAFVDWAELAQAHHTGGSSAVRELLERSLSSTEERMHRCHTHTRTGLNDGNRYPLFPPVNQHGHLGKHVMSGRAVADLVKRYAYRAGLDPRAFSGHSLRSGFATQAALSGADDRAIMRQGRWTNPKTVHGYIRTANPLDDNAVTHLGL